MPLHKIAHKARHAAPYSASNARAAAARSTDYEPKHGGGVLVVTHGGMDRRDVRILPLAGPQAGWQ